MEDGRGNAETPRGATLATELGGDLPCARCRYNLRGLSIRAVCPECATPVRATLLAVVDPMASELRPVHWPRLTAGGLILWSAAALAAALCVWSLRLGGGRHLPLAEIVVGLTALSGVGALALVRPHEGPMADRNGRLAMLGVALYASLCGVLWMIHAGADAAGANPYTFDHPPAPRRLVLRLVASGLMLVILLCLRPNARVLAARSLLMRTGRVDRQTMLAMAAVLGLAMLGDALRLLGAANLGAARDLLAQVGVGAVFVASVLFTAGLLGIVVDCVRLAAVIVEPPLTLGQLLGKEERR